MPASSFPRLRQPPISEVVCGFIFDPIPELTPTQHGAYWVARKGDFPKHEVHGPLVDQATQEQFEISLGPPLIRTWLVSGDDTRLVQLQNDRFFTNWRRRRETDAYPRFHSHDGSPGLLAYALAEFVKFTEFARSVGKVPTVRHIELTKIDVLVQGKHWKDLVDFRGLLPWAAYSLDLGVSDRPAILLRLEDKMASGSVVRVTAANGQERDTKAAVIRLETTMRAECDQGSLEAGFQAMNERVNAMFFKLIPGKELGRFGVESV